MLNVLHNDGSAAHPRDRLMRAIQGSRPGLPMQPTLNVDPECGPIVGDTFATLVCRKVVSWPILLADTLRARQQCEWFVCSSS